MNATLQQVPVQRWLHSEPHVDAVERVRGKDRRREALVYGYGTAWFGRFMAAYSSEGLCAFEPHADETAPVRLLGRWAPCDVRRDDHRVLSALHDALGDSDTPQRLHLCGTEFQLAVWQALLCVPRCGRVTYGDLATMIGRPRAARALGNAVAANPVALLVPCHRVVPADGGLGQYRWGQALKWDLLNREQLVSGRLPLKRPSELASGRAELRH